MPPPILPSCVKVVLGLEHIFNRVCRENSIDQSLTKVPSWTNGQVERMNRTIKEAMVKWYHYDIHSQPGTHVTDVIAAYNYARRLKMLKGLTPFEYICKSGHQSQKASMPIQTTTHWD